MKKQNAPIDQLWQMYSIQQRQQLNWCNFDIMSTQQKMEETKATCLNIVGEVIQLLDTTDYKRHVLRQKPFNRGNYTEELVDILKYWLNLAIIQGITPEELFERFLDKTKLVQERYEIQTIEWNQGSLLVCTDLDGPVQHPSGKPAEGCIDILKSLKQRGYYIAIITARELRETKNLYYETKQWLDDAGVPYDFLLSGKDKYDVLRDNFHPAHPAFFVEDSGEYAYDLANKGVQVYLLNRIYNQGVKHKNIRRVSSWHEIGAIAGMKGAIR